MTDDAADLSLVEILGRLTDRKLSARELVNDCLRRIETAEPTLRAFVTQTPHLALAAARRADDARAKGLPVGPLAGVPVAVKDLFLTRGVLTTAGSRVFVNSATPGHCVAQHTPETLIPGTAGRPRRGDGRRDR